MFRFSDFPPMWGPLEPVCFHGISQHDPNQKELFKKVRILKMNSPEGETPRTERTANKVRILKRNCPEGETPQTEGTVRKSQDSENEVTKNGDVTDRKNCSTQIRIVKMDSPQRERAYIKQDQKPQSQSRHPKTSPGIQHTSPDTQKYKSGHPKHKFRVYIGIYRSIWSWGNQQPVLGNSSAALPEGIP